MKKIALIKMPWGAVATGSLALSILKSALIEKQIKTDVIYLNVRMAKHIDLNTYTELYKQGDNYIGEWTFAQHLFRDGVKNVSENFDDYFRYLFNQPELVGIASNLRKLKKEIISIVSDVIPKFTDESLNTIVWEDYSMVGFTTTVGEYLSVLYFARRLKERFPEIKIALGGFGVCGEAGIQTLKDFNWIDYAIDGEGEVALPMLAQKVNEGKYYEDIPGVSYRKGNSVIARKDMFPLINLDESPIPDYSDYYNELDICGFRDTLGKILPFESSRGCLWGEKTQCSFCSEGFFSKVYRAKSSDRFLNELSFLSKEYKVTNFFTTDNLLNPKYFNDVIPKLVEIPHNLNIVYHIKPDIKKDSLSMLMAAGINKVKPGIETLNSRLLNLMRKGHSALSNIQLLKLSQEVGMWVFWNFLYKIPGERKEDYEEILRILPSIMHLQPPNQIFKISLDKNSLYYRHPEKFGIKDIQPSGKFTYLFPEGVGVDNLAYQYDYTCQGYKDNPDSYTQPVLQKINYWQRLFTDKKIYCNYTYRKGDVVITDNRLLDDEYAMISRTTVLNGNAALIYHYCSEIRSVKDICERIADNSKLDTENQVQCILDKLVNEKLMIEENKKYLSLAVFKNDQE